jgi:acetyl esterase/lipase
MSTTGRNYCATMRFALSWDAELHNRHSVIDHRVMSNAINLEQALDEMHAAVLAMLPPTLLDLTDLAACRTQIDMVLGAAPVPPMPENVTLSEVHVPGVDGDPDVRVKMYTPNDLPAGSPALVWIHGGGMVLLSADGDDFQCASRAAKHNCLVASVDYRLAPETAAPGLVNDCYAAFRHVANNADALGIDASRIVIGGASAGGGLAAGTALFARDQGGQQPSAQLLVFPMLDHSNTTESSHAIVDTRVWNRPANLLAWGHYLGGQAPTIYSSPSMCEDLSGLPPAHINVGTFDMFHDEDIAYATALNRAGVACELHVYPGAFHGSQGFVVDHPTSKRWVADEEAFLARALAGEV